MDETMVAENRQLRQERDLLLQKLVRSKGALKETLDRLTTSNQLKKDQLSPMPPRRMLSSSSVLQSAGEGPSRAKVTQDLLEFSKFRHQKLPGSRDSNQYQGELKPVTNSQSSGRRPSVGRASKSKSQKEATRYYNQDL